MLKASDTGGTWHPIYKATKVYIDNGGINLMLPPNLLNRQYCNQIDHEGAP